MIPFDEGIIDVRVAVTANPLVNDTLLLAALIVKATGVSEGVDGGVGVDPPPSEDLEQEMIEPITIGRTKNIFFISRLFANNYFFCLVKIISCNPDKIITSRNIVNRNRSQFIFRSYHFYVSTFITNQSYF